MIQALGRNIAGWRGRVCHALFGGPEYQVQDDGTTARLVCKDCGTIVIEGPSGALDNPDLDPELAYVRELLRRNGREVYSRVIKPDNHPQERK